MIVIVIPAQLMCSKSMNESKNCLTAIHEAGHAVAHFIFRDVLPESFEYATIISDQEQGSAGHIKLILGGNLNDPSCFDFTHCDELNSEMAGFDQRVLEAKLSTLLAGEAATYVETGERNDHGTGRESWSGDFDSSMGYLESIFGVGEDVESPGNKAAFHYVETLFWRTVVLFQHPGWREKIEAIAKALIEKRTLSFEECETVAFPNKTSGLSDLAEPETEAQQ